jgi:hypothetical protein
MEALFHAQRERRRRYLGVEVGEDLVQSADGSGGRGRRGIGNLRFKGRDQSGACGFDVRQHATDGEGTRSHVDGG